MPFATCKAIDMSLRFGEYSRRLGKGSRVDLDQVVGTKPPVYRRDPNTQQVLVVDGVEQIAEPARPMTVRDLIAGREECFEIDPDPAAPRADVSGDQG